MIGCGIDIDALELVSVTISIAESGDGEKGGSERAIELSLSSSVGSTIFEADCNVILSLSCKAIKEFLVGMFIGS